MAIDRRIGTKVDKIFRREEATATRVDPYPYIGVVKNNYDPTRSGRIQVWIPDFGGDQEDDHNWRTVSYASPFMGYTGSGPKTGDPKTTSNSFDTVPHSYGMWMVPPDIGVEVIVLFIAGDPLRGYWLACVNSNLSQYMMPGLAGSKNFIGATEESGRVPVVEFNENGSQYTNNNFVNAEKPVHKIQYQRLIEQGLHFDPVRGSISSSSQRESPSHVFGISTPGRPTNDPADDVNYLKNLRAGKEDDKYRKIKSRKGGHQFVMDDGEVLGDNQLVRLKTASGHQLLMHDSNDSIYISHAKGESWIEMSNQGDIKIYSKSGFSLRSEGTINMHSDANINFDAGGTIRMRSQNKIQMETGTTTFKQDKFHVETQQDTQFKTGARFLVDADAKISVKAGGILALEGLNIYSNSGRTETVDQIKRLAEFKLPDTSQPGGPGTFWQLNLNALPTICTLAPTHEPYYRGEQQSDLEKETGIQPKATFAGKIDATKSLAGSGVDNGVKAVSVRNQPEATREIGPLSKDDLTAYYAQIGQSESSMKYDAENELGYLGKYQMGLPALKDAGFVRSDVKSLSDLDNANSWTGKDGISSKDAFKQNPKIQESAMEDYTERNYTAMVANGAITADMPKEEVGGMLATSHLLGATGAKNWRATGQGADANGTTGGNYFQKGKYAVAQMAPKVGAIQAG